MNNKKIALTEQERKIILAILKNYPKTILFGSRIKGTSKQFSDLDICLKDELKDYEIQLLREAFEESRLPFKVDIVVYYRVDDVFKKIIDDQAIPLTALVE